MKPKGGHYNHEEINFTLLESVICLRNEYFTKEKKRESGMYVGFGGSYDLGPSKGMTGSSRWGQVPNG